MSTDPRENRHSDTTLEVNAKRAFAASVDRLDGATRSRLARARAAAMAAAEAPARHALFGSDRVRIVAVGAVAALAIAVVWLPGRTPAPAVELTAFDDLDILLDEEDLDLFEELEFYAWLEAQAALEETTADADGSG